MYGSKDVYVSSEENLPSNDEATEVKRIEFESVLSNQEVRQTKEIATSCNFPKFKPSNETELQLALALSKSLHETERLQDVGKDLVKLSKVPFAKFQKDRKVLPENFNLRKSKIPVASYETKFRKRKLNNPTTLQISNVEIRDRILTKNLARILMEDESVDGCNEISSQACFKKICLEENNCWNFTTFWNELVPIFLLKDEFQMRDVNEEKSSKISEYLINENCTAGNHINGKCTNLKPLYCQGGALITEKIKEEEVVNEDYECFKILSNLVNICSLNEYIHQFLKRLEFLALATKQQSPINLESTSDLEHGFSPQNKQQKFSDSEGICSSKIDFKVHKNLFTKRAGEFIINDEIYSNTENRIIKSNLMRQEQLTPNSTAKTDQVFALSPRLRKTIETKCEPINFRSSETHNSFVEVISANESEKSELCVFNSEEMDDLETYKTIKENNLSIRKCYVETDCILAKQNKDMAVMSDLINTNLVSFNKNTNVLEGLKDNNVTNHKVYVCLSDDETTDSVPIQKKLKIIQKTEDKFTDNYDKKHRIITFNADYECEENNARKCTSNNWKSHKGVITPLSTECMDNIISTIDFSTMETSELKRELRKYGLKFKNHDTAIQLLKHIHGELQPIMCGSHKTLPLNAEFDSINKNVLLEETCSSELCKNKSTSSDLCELDWTLINNTKTESKSRLKIDSKKIEFLNKDQDCSDSKIFLESMFKSNSELLKKILKYQPLNLNLLRVHLKKQGLKWNNNSFMAFLDEQSITFFTDLHKEKII